VVELPAKLEHPHEPVIQLVLHTGARRHEKAVVAVVRPWIAQL